MDTAATHPLLELQQTLYASGNATRRRLHRDRLRWVVDRVRRCARALRAVHAVEFGPGSGVYLPTLAEECGHVTAADVESAYLDGLRELQSQLPNLDFLVDDLQDSRLRPGSVDLVLCSEVLEHVPDPERALLQLHRVLRPGGLAVVTTPQRYSVMELCCKVAFLPGVIDIVRRIYREPILPTGHISLRSRGAFRRAIGAAGFDVVETAAFGLYVPLLAEFGGDRGGRAIEALERRLSGSVAEHLFWTQAYVLRKPAGSR